MFSYDNHNIMKRIIILLLGAICLIRCGQDEFWSYQYNGVFLCSKDVGFYPVEADFFPSENGCDLLVITQKDEDGKITATSGFIVKYKKGDLELIDGANGSPVFGIKLENGSKYTHPVSYIKAKKETISLWDGADFHLELRRGEKNKLDLYKK